MANEYYERFVELARNRGIKTEHGVFAAHMEVGLVNDGPVTILIDSKNLLGGINLEVIRIPAGIYAANCYLVYDEDTKEGIVIDPGGDVDDIIAQIDKLDLKLNILSLLMDMGTILLE